MDIFYLIGSFAGIAMLVGLSAVLFGTKAKQLADTHDLEVYLAQVAPTFRARDIALAPDGKAALAENAANGAIHLVVSHGDGLVTRRLSKTTLRSVERRGATLVLRLTDFTLPYVRLALGDAVAASHWEEKISGAFV